MSDQKSALETNEIEFSDRYSPLFHLLECWEVCEEHEDSISFDPEDPEYLYFKELSTVHTVCISGGRDSGKSFALSLFNASAAADYNHRILFTRQTMSSTDNSIKQALKDRMALLGIDGEFQFANNNFLHTANEESKGKITITGQKTSSGTETAKLKSLEDYSIFETDEAEELVSYEEWKKIKRSLRAQDVQCLSIISFNPPTREHWIAIEFYDGVPDGFNGIKNGILYIHTTYLDNGKENMAEHNWLEYEKLRLDYEYYQSLPKEERELVSNKIKKNHDEYKYSILGSFKNKAEGVIYEDWEEGEFDETLDSLFGLDFGSNDPDALIKVAVDEDQKKIYLKEEFFKNNTSFEGLLNVLEDRCSYNNRIVADAAERRMIIDYRNLGFDIHKAKKQKGSVAMGIKKIQSYTLIVDPESNNIKKALNNYRWHDKKAGFPCHDWSDICDAFRYAAMDVIGFKPGML